MESRSAVCQLQIPSTRLEMRDLLASGPKFALHGGAGNARRKESDPAKWMFGAKSVSRVYFWGPKIPAKPSSFLGPHATPGHRKAYGGEPYSLD